MKIKKGDFIEIDFVARVKENNQIFDLTNEGVAKENNLFSEGRTFKPIIICVGERHVISGLDESLVDKEVGKEYKIEIKAEDAFGKRNPKLFQLIGLNKFKDEKIKPFPGMQVNVDNLFGIVKSVSGGRILVDFNHPLAEKGVVYEVKILRKIENDKEKLRGFLNIIFNMDIKFELKDNKAVIDLDLNNDIKNKIKERIKKIIPGIKEIDFKTTDRK